MWEPVEVVQRAYEAFSYGDWETARRFVDPGVTWSLLADRPEVSADPDRGGPMGIMSYWAMIFRQYRVRPREYIPRGDYVIVPVDLYGRGGRGASHREEVWSVCVQDGKIRSVDEFADVDTALQAAVDARRAS